MLQDQPIRIMDLRGTYKGGGGPDKTILLSAAKHNKECFFVLVTYLRDPQDSEFQIEERARNLGIDYIDVPDRQILDWSCILKLNKILREYHISIIHSHDDKTSLYAFFLKMLNPRIKIMYTCHLYSMYERTDFPSFKAYLSFRLRKNARFFLLSRSHRPILAVSEAVRQTLISEGLKPDEVETIYNGIDIEQWQRGKGHPILKAELGLPQNAVLIGTVARITYQKDFSTFFQVSAIVKSHVPNVSFVVVGDGEENELERAKTEAQDLGVADYVFFTGHRNDLIDIYASFDLFLMTSISEGLPNTVLEAMAMEIPVVSTAVDGVPELVLDGETGYLCEIKDVNCLSNKVVKLLREKDVRKRFGKVGRERVVESFSFAERVKTMERYYERFYSC